jgi:hypothetical protein
MEKNLYNFLTTSFVKFRKGCGLENKCKMNCFGKVILLLGMAARWHPTTVGKGGREAGGGGRVRRVASRTESTVHSYTWNNLEIHTEIICLLCAKVRTMSIV